MTRRDVLTLGHRRGRSVVTAAHAHVARGDNFKDVPPGDVPSGGELPEPEDLLPDRRIVHFES